MEIEIVAPWHALSGDKEAADLQKRLEFEVTPRHPLWERQARVIARSDATDDVVVVTADRQFAIVHLVWGKLPGDETWPATAFFSSADELVQALRAWPGEG